MQFRIGSNISVCDCNRKDEGTYEGVSVQLESQGTQTEHWVVG